MKPLFFSVFFLFLLLNSASSLNLCLDCCSSEFEGDGCDIGAGSPSYRTCFEGDLDKDGIPDVYGFGDEGSFFKENLCVTDKFLFNYECTSNNNYILEGEFGIFCENECFMGKCTCGPVLTEGGCGEDMICVVDPFDNSNKLCMPICHRMGGVCSSSSVFVGGINAWCSSEAYICKACEIDRCEKLPKSNECIDYPLPENCDFFCTDTSMDTENCGSCGNACQHGEVCTDGACVHSGACGGIPICDGTNLNNCILDDKACCSILGSDGFSEFVDVIYY